LIDQALEPKCASSGISVSKRIPSLDGIRALAISLILVLHISQHYRSLFANASIFKAFVGHDEAMWPGDGVGIFFVLSGFLITTLLLKEFNKTDRIDIRSFYTRRAFRILPPLLVYLAFAAGFCLYEHIPFDPASFMAALFFYRDYFFAHNLWLAQHTWSLSVEEQFYLLWPIALLLLLRFKGRKAAAWFAGGLILITPLLRVLVSRTIPPLAHEEYYMLHARMDALMSGCLVALCVGMPKFEAVYQKIAKVWWLLPLEFWTVSHLLGVPYRKTVGLTIDSVVMAFFILWAARNADHWVGRFLNSRIMVQAGVLSYSAYLWQTFFLHQENTTWSGKFPFSIAYIWIAAWASYTFVEQPCLRLRDRLMRSPRIQSAKTELLNSPSSLRKRNIDLDFLRGIAILSVIGLHIELPATHYQILSLVMEPFKQMGGRGVDLFFVLSGFLVGGLLLKEYRDRGLVNGRRFLIRRGFKIWPAYYVFILFNVVARHHPLNTFLFANLLHLQNYLGSSLSQTWSLAIEEHFYIALALFFIWASQKRLSTTRLLQILGVMCFIALLLRTNDAINGRLSAAFSQTQNRMDSLLYGVILATLYWLLPEKFEALTRRKWPLIATTIALLALMYWLPAYPVLDESIGYTLVPIGLMALISLVFVHASAIHNWLLYRAIAWVGLYSYGIYLWHSVVRQPAKFLLDRFHITRDPAAWIVALVFQLGLSIALGYAMSRIVEFPFLYLRDRIFPSKIQSSLEIDPVQSELATQSGPRLEVVGQS
jgi:peptidoglycan/LPS O-acetylase OafA/YrhL